MHKFVNKCCLNVCKYTNILQAWHVFQHIHRNIYHRFPFVHSIIAICVFSYVFAFQKENDQENVSIYQ